MIIPRTTHGLAHALFKNLTTMIVVFGVFVGGCIAYLLTATPVYQATASLAIDFSANATVDIAAAEGGEVVLPETRRATVANYERLLTSRDLLSEIIEEVGIQRLFPDFDEPAIVEAQSAASTPEALQSLQTLLSGAGLGADDAADGASDQEPIANPGALTPRERLLSKAVRLFREDFMIDSSQDNTVIELSYFHEDPDLANYTLGRIIEKFISRRAEIFRNPHLPFLEKQLEDAEQALTLAQEKMFGFQRENGIFLAEAQLERMVNQRETIQSEIDSLSYELDALEGDEGGRSRLAATRNTMEARIDFLRRQIANVDDRISVHVAAEHKLAQFEQEVESKERTYEAVLDRIEAARFAERANAGAVSPISVLDQPKSGDKPARPRKLLLLFASVVLGGVAALAAGVGREILQTRFATPEQVESELELPTLGVIGADAPNLLNTLFSPRGGARRAKTGKREEKLKRAAAKAKARAERVAGKKQPAAPAKAETQPEAQTEAQNAHPAKATHAGGVRAKGERLVDVSGPDLKNGEIRKPRGGDYRSEETSA